MADDSKKLTRLAQPFLVDYSRAVGSPPSYGTWLPLWDAKGDRVEINHGAKPSVITLWFPKQRWNVSPLSWGDKLRIKVGDSIVFIGYVIKLNREFSGGSERPGAGYERTAVVCMDARWAVSACSIIFGQFARGPDNRNSSWPFSPLGNGGVHLAGRRCIFNPDGLANMDPDELTLMDVGLRVFSNPGPGSSYWTARQMVRYLLHPLWKKVLNYLPVDDPAAVTGLDVMSDAEEDKKNWGKVLYNITVEGLNTIEAVALICRHIAWDFRIDYSGDKPVLAFFKTGSGTKHRLYAPAVGENISAAVAAGNKMLWSMSLDQDISPVVNNPFAACSPSRFEFTAELVPGWLDSVVTYGAHQLGNLYKTDAELQQLTDPDEFLFYSNYHTRGAAFNSGSGVGPNLRDVGRKWVLNETGQYSNPASGSYNRGAPFLWESVLPSNYVYFTADGITKRYYGLFNRRLLPCLTVLRDGVSSVGIRLEFSFDAGQTWQIIPCSVRLLERECGIYITEPNLAEIVDKKESTILSGDLAGVPVNLFTSIIDDKVNGRSFVRGSLVNWRTRVRVTASVQLDTRIVAAVPVSPDSGSPFDQSQLYDFSDRYGIARRSPSSVFAASPAGLYANEYDSTSVAVAHVDSLRKNNEGMAVSGRFTLDRIWPGEFNIGDSIEAIDGRDFDLSLLAFGGGKSVPEIIQIIYLPESQKQVLITRDLRYAEVRV